MKNWPKFKTKVSLKVYSSKRFQSTPYMFDFSKNWLRKLQLKNKQIASIFLTNYTPVHNGGNWWGHIDIDILSNLLSNVSSYEPLLVLNNQLSTKNDSTLHQKPIYTHRQLTVVKWWEKWDYDCRNLCTGLEDPKCPRASSLCSVLNMTFQ